jgi:hypothetical protein
MVEASEDAEDDVNIIDDEEAANYADLMGEIRDFVAMARKETSGERVYCRWRVEADELELVLATQEGGRLDSRTFAVADLPVSPYELVETMSSFVAIIPAISPGSARPTHH